MSEYYADGYVDVGIWAKRTAGWQKVQTQTHYVSDGPYFIGGIKSLSFAAVDLVVQLGTNVLAVGVSVEGGEFATAGIDSFTKLAWQAQGSTGGTRSATPNGEKTTVIVTP